VKLEIQDFVATRGDEVFGFSKELEVRPQILLPCFFAAVGASTLEGLLFLFDEAPGPANPARGNQSAALNGPAPGGGRGVV